MKATRLRTESMIDPIGISTKIPRLSWVCEGGLKQTAYQIAAKDRDSEKTLWDSGKIQSSQMAYIPWGADPLPSRIRVEWKVRLWDEHDTVGDWSDTAFFERGLEEADWKASWITGDFKPRRRANKVTQYITKPKKRYPVDCFRKIVQVSKPIKKARFYASACGLYEISVDGKKVGSWCLAPGITDYRMRVQAQTLDATKHFTENHNHSITILLADGWYRGSVGAWGLLDQYGTQTKVIAQLVLTYEDGSEEIIVTDASWEWSNDGPIRFADNKDGEIVDASRSPSYSGRARTANHTVLPVSSDNLPLTEQEIFKPFISRTPSGKVLLDMGQNFAGYIAFSVNARQGQRLILRFGEMLMDGELTQDNFQLKLKSRITPKQEINYTCCEGQNNYKTRFAIFGYQYVEISGDEDLLSDIVDGKADFSGIAVYSDFERIGFFESSNPLLDQLVEATVWSTKSNSADLPTDCPTRERHGWTGDAQIFIKSASYLFDYRSFAKKYLNDIYDLQYKNGNLPQIAPYGGVDFFMGTMNGSSGWSDAGIFIPYRLAEVYRDEQILRKFYPRMAKFARFLERRCGKWTPLRRKAIVSGENKKYLVNCGASYGEWSEPEDVFINKWTEQVFPHAEVSTAYSSYVFRLMAEIAEHLDKPEDAAEFRRFSEGCKSAYQELVSTPEYSLDTDRQSLLVRPLALNLLTEEQITFAKDRLIQAMENYRWRLGTGFLSTPFILNVLMEIDIEYAYKLLENEEIPGWLSMPRQGATTIWESWEGPYTKGGAGAGSLNHYSKGSVVEWLFEKMCGIRMDGENHFTIAPHPGGNFTYAKASYHSVYGQVVSSWSKDDDGSWCYEITIPANCSATVSLPDTQKQEVGAGVYKFSSKGETQ